jgi:CDP-glycerol glycerophosphotransferase (TagB/SpsB family)
VKHLETTEHEFAFFTSRKVKAALSKVDKKFKLLDNLSEAIRFKADFVLVPGNFVDFRIPGSKIQIFHGLGVEKKSHYKIRHFFDCYCTSGPCVTEKFIQLQKKYKYFHVLETGWPKADHILNFPVGSVSNFIEIPPGKKVILFAPTHSRKMESASALINVLPGILRKDEFLLVKFHELMARELVADFRRKLQDNAFFIDDYDITPYLVAADVLISDTSSVLYEFMLLDKPVITYKTQSRFDKGINITEPELLRDVLDWTLQNPKAHSKNREKHLAEINPYRDGKISQRLIEVLIENKAELEKIKKPMNLFRKWQILYHSGFKKGYLR